MLEWALKLANSCKNMKILPSHPNPPYDANQSVKKRNLLDKSSKNVSEEDSTRNNINSANAPFNFLLHQVNANYQQQPANASENSENIPVMEREDRELLRKALSNSKVRSYF
jgi:hypothetical protein